MRFLKPKFFKSVVAPGLITGVASTTATHPFEQAQIGTENLPKYISVRDTNGKVIGRQKNPARFGTLRMPGTNKKWEFDKGDSKQHYLARIPKGIAGWGTMGILGYHLPKLKFFR